MPGLLEFLFRWEVVTAVVGILIGVGFAVLAFGDFRIAKTCFLLATADLAGGIVMWGVTTAWGAGPRLVAVAICFGLIGILTVESLRYVDSKREKRAHREERPGAKIEQNTTPPGPLEQSLRLKYSSTQVIQVSNEPGNDQALNLDSAATLIPFGANLDSIEMVLPASTPLTVDRPDARQRYQVGEGHTARFPAANSPGISIKSPMMFTGAKSFVFDRVKSVTQTIEIGKRRFRVTLLSVRDKSTAKRRLIEYTFGISE